MQKPIEDSNVYDKMRILSVNILQREYIVSQVNDFHGFTSSIVQGSGINSEFLYLAGRYHFIDNTSEKADLAFVRYKPDTMESVMSRLVYKVDDCVTQTGSDLIDEGAAYISHIAYMEADGVSEDQLFGIGTSSYIHDFDLYPFHNALVWRAELQTSGDADSNKFRAKKLDVNSDESKNYIIGMRSRMERDSASGSYYIHAIYIDIELAS